MTADDRPETLTSGGEWIPAVPLPLYVRSWRTWFRWRYQCQCGKVWSTEIVYEIHYRAEHLS